MSIIPPEHEIGNSVWAERGWTYQELLLSRRRLVFTDFQVYFDCDRMFCVENTRWKSLLPFSTPFLEGPWPYEIFLGDNWYKGVRHNIFEAFRTFENGWNNIWDHIRSYYVRELSFKEDRLNAFHEIFSSHMGRRLCDHYWGIPIFHSEQPVGHPRFLEGLAWRVEGQHEETSRLSFPSWRWASFAGGHLRTDGIEDNLWEKVLAPVHIGRFQRQARETIIPQRNCSQLHNP